ncbi:MAG: amino acid permease [Megasphaera sp.]|jgi:APA family basic amino acid/polyamine antiporter|nr:amino acid permease [Megasphaera sp.]
MNLLRRKPISEYLNNMKNSQLKKTLNALDITVMGLGVTIGTGIFVLTGVVAARYAGPGVMLSFVLAGITCIFVALAYSELASTLPVAGSSYTYTYATLGEIFAWIVGWGLVMEYTIGAAAVSVGWGAYFTGLLKSANISFPALLTHAPVEGGFVNLPSMVIVWIVTACLIIGVRESAKLNRILVFIKLLVIFTFLLLAGPKINTMNYEPFLPFGWSGVSAGASVIFFAYIGFDCVATAAEETKNPSRDMPIGIIVSLLLCTILYISVCAVLTGVVSYKMLDNAEPVTYVLRSIGYNFASALVGTGALCGLTTVVLVLIYSQSRAFYAMSRDGLLPKIFSDIDESSGNPVKVTVVIGIIVSLMAGFTPIDIIAEMTSAGTLCAFLCAVTGVIILRKKHPELHRPFICPALYIMAPIGIICCLYLFYNLSFYTHLLFFTWLMIGLVFYGTYGYKHSHLNFLNKS